MQINNREQHQSQCEKNQVQHHTKPVYGCDYHPRMEHEGYLAPPIESFGGIPSQKKGAIGCYWGWVERVKHVPSGVLQCFGLIYIYIYIIIYIYLYI